MKKVKFCSFLLITLFAGLFIACSSDDDDYDLSTLTQEQIETNLIGTWKYVESGGEAGEEWTHNGTWQFFADGNLKTHEEGWRDDTFTWNVEQDNGKWYIIWHHEEYEIVRMSSNSFEVYEEIHNGSRVVGYSRYTCKRQ